MVSMSRTIAAAMLTVSLAGAATSVRDFGAKGDGIAKDTGAIQRAIDGATKQGDGTVLLPAGRYISGPIHLKSNITVHLENGAILNPTSIRTKLCPSNPSR